MQSSVTCVNVLQCECSQWRQQCSSPAALLSIKHRECDSRRRKPSCPLAHFCGLASPWNRNLSKNKNKSEEVIQLHKCTTTCFSSLYSFDLPVGHDLLNVLWGTVVWRPTFFFFFFRKAKVADAYEPIKCWLKSQHSLKVWGQDDIRTRSIRITLSGASSVRKRLFSCMATRWAWAHLHGEQSDRQ